MAYLLAAPSSNRTVGTVLPTDANGGRQLHPPTQLLGYLHTIGRPSSKTNPLFVAAVYATANAKISNVDLKLVDVATGATVAWLDRQGNGHFGVTGGLLCLVGTSGTTAVSVLDPATGDITGILTCASGNEVSSAYVFGHVPTTEKHKILRVYAAAHSVRHGGAPTEHKQFYEILTLDSEQ